MINVFDCNEFGRQRPPFFYAHWPKCHGVFVVGKKKGKPPFFFLPLFRRRNCYNMKWLTLQKIKQQCRIESDFTEEDSLLDMYGESAEEVLLNHLRRSYEDIMEEYGQVPAPLVHASLMLVDVSYQHRSPVSQQNMSIVPYTFDILTKPYMRLANNENDNENDNRYVCTRL